jgi:septum site-determining protein MinC
MRRVLLEMCYPHITYRPVSSLSRKFFSTNAKSRDYLSTWLGNDMSGESYHKRMVAQALEKRQQNVATSAEAEKDDAGVQGQRANVGASMSTNSMAANSLLLSKDEVSCLYTQNYSLVSLETDFSKNIEEMKQSIARRMEDLKKNSEEILDNGIVINLSTVTLDSKDQCDALFNFVEKDLQIQIKAVTNCTDETLLSHIQSNHPNIHHLVHASLDLERQYGHYSSPLASISQTGSKNTMKDTTPQLSSPSSSLTSTPKQNNTQIHYGAVRSGQQVYAEGSLIVMGSVNNGGEVLADGHIHVYGALKGRAVAGLGGFEDACIFAKSFDPDLIAIGDAFLAPDESPDLSDIKGKEVVIRLQASDEDINANGKQKRISLPSSTVIKCGDSGSLIFSML